MRFSLLLSILSLSTQLFATDYYTVKLKDPQLEKVKIFHKDIYLVGEWHSKVYTNKTEVQLFDQIIKANPSVNCLLLEVSPRYIGYLTKITAEEVNQEFKTNNVSLFGEAIVWAKNNNIKILANDKYETDDWLAIKNREKVYEGFGNRSSYLANSYMVERNQYFIDNINKLHSRECEASIFLVGLAHITESGEISYFNNTYEPINYELDKYGISSQKIVISPMRNLVNTKLYLNQESRLPGTKYQKQSLNDVKTMIFHE